MSLQQKAVSGVFWSFLQKGGDRGIQFIITVFLARLLLPEDFGLIGMLTIFIVISQSLVQAGFNKALIQKKNADEVDYSTVFYINLSVSVFLYIVLYLCAPLIASFYNQPELTSLTRVLSLVFILNAFGYVQETKLIKEIQFKRLMIIHLPSTIISGVVAIIMAYNGFGVWSIVAQRLILRLVFVIQMWFYSSWKPLWIFSKEKAKSLFSFGGNLMLVGIIQLIYLNGYKVVIGKFYSTSTLGYYENANGIAMAPVSTILSVVSSVTFSVFSSIQDDNRRLKIGYKKSIQQVLFILSPFLVLSMALAEPLFRFVLSEKWLPAVPIYQILCVGFIFLPLSEYNAEILKVKGHSKLFLKINIIKRIIETIGIAVSLIYFDIWMLIWFQSVFSMVKYLINGFFSGKLIGYSTFEQFKDISGILILSSLIGVMIYLLNTYLFNNFTDLFKLLGGFGTGFILYWILAKLFSFQTLSNITDLAKSFFMKS